MITASYARYSSDQQREASITDQERNADAVAGRHGLTITLRYRDKAVSGSDPTRADYQRMMAEAKAGRFQALKRMSEFTALLCVLERIFE